MRRPLTLLFALCGWLGASPAAEATEARSSLPSVWARYALIRRGARVEHLVVVRSGDRVEHRYLERAETDLWERDRRGEVEHVQIYPKEKRAVHFTPGDLRTIAMTPHWDGLTGLVSDKERAALGRRGTTASLGGRRAIVHHGTLRGQPARLAWLADLALPANLTLGRGATRVELRLVELQDCSGKRCAETTREDLRVLEFADLGDMEHDPFARRFLHSAH